MTRARPVVAVQAGAGSAPVSVLVLTYEEEKNIGACLDSVVGWADQILVVDSGSRDGTLALCRERGVEVVQHAYLDHRSQMEWAITALPWKHAWLLLLDADNQVTAELKQDIEQALAADDGSVHGYYNPHRQYFRNRAVHQGGKGHWLRLIRRSHAVVDPSELVDFRLIIEGPTGTLKGAIVENNQKEFDIDFWIDKHQKFARRMAVEEILRNEGLLEWSKALRPKLFGNPDERMVWLKNRWYKMPLHVRALVYFSYRYVFQLGFLDGSTGFVYHVFQALWYRMLVDLQILEYRAQLSAGKITLADLVQSVGLPSSVLQR